MTTFCEDFGGFHSGGAADYDEPLRHPSRRQQRSGTEFPLTTGGRIDGAGDGEDLESTADAALVAANAVIDFVLSTLPDLVRELGSAICARIIASMPALPKARIPSAWAGSLSPPTTIYRNTCQSDPVPGGPVD